MANKCLACGKFHSAADGIACCDCAGTYHRACVGAPEGVALAAGWYCLSCKRKARREMGDNTPVKGLSSQFMITEDVPAPISPNGQDFSGEGGADDGPLNNTATDTTVEFKMDLALEIRMFREELSSVKVHCSNEISNVICEFRQLREELTSFKSAVQACNERLEVIESRMDVLEAKLAKTAMAPNTELERTVEDLRMQLQDRDQEILANDIQVSNVPETGGDNPMHIVTAIAMKLGVVLDERDVVCAYRIGVRSAGEGGSVLAARPRPLIVRFARRATRDNMLRSARVRRGATTADMGLQGEARRFYVNERLTKVNRQLFQRARELCREKGWRYVWTRDGRVHVRQSEGKIAIRIRSDNDLNNIFNNTIV